MRIENIVAAWTVTVVLTFGLVWALSQLRVRHRAAILVAVACGIALLQRLVMWLVVPYVFRHFKVAPEFRAGVMRSASLVYLLVTAAAFLLLILAALPVERVAPARAIGGLIHRVRNAGLPDPQQPED